MRVLWFSFTAAGANRQLKKTEAGCGWIASLEDCIREVPGVKLGIGFFHDSTAANFEANGVTYYPIQKKYQGLAGKFKQRISTSMYDVNPVGIKAVIEDFKPDVIHLFGTESGMVDVLKTTSLPVIVHLQGLVRPYLSAWFPKGMSQASIFIHSSLRAVLLRRGHFFEYILFRKRAEREDAAIKAAHNFFGRTSWDKNYLELVKKDFNYFHCEEVLRPVFYQHQWQQPAGGRSRLVSVLNPQLYKGFEMILQTSAILKNMVQLDFEWHVIGMAPNDEMVPIVEKAMSLRFAENNVSLRGAKIEQELINELTAANLFIHPSHIDNSPNSVCEAMLLGMPVIAGNVGGLSSLITHNTDGILYNSYDPYELAGIIKRGLENPAEMTKLGKEARARALRRHDTGKITETVIEAYKKISAGQTVAKTARAALGV